MSTILCKSFALSFPNESTFYLKPVSTGPLNEADDGHVSHFSPLTRTKCLFQFDEAVSPHIAARSSRVSDLSIPIKRDLNVDLIAAPT
jgi:dethiobiotin synthetase/adenosylmethionine--8-amino-7-oxononanoate aminotransferase